ncbi:MAG: hypothetical protein ACI8U3_002494 [Brevundimonas sp.]|jgi:hypothetical protein|uniref:hypothetical protein n=1 Tax=Brevundimonas sp. TaxID=1871086 RepID=UPI0039E66977
MIAWMIATALTAVQPSAAERWTWTLYESGDGAPVVLANEIPDTANLRATLECEPGVGAARVAVYGVEGASSGYVSFQSGDARAAAQGETAEEAGIDRLTASLRLEHPVFAAFAETGRLSLVQGEHRWPVRVPAAHRALITDFAAACGG